MQNCNYWEKESKWGEYYHCPDWQFLDCCIGRGTPKESMAILLSWGNRLDFSKAEVATICGQSSTEDKATQRKNYRNLHRGIFESLAQWHSAHEKNKTLWDWSKTISWTWQTVSQSGPYGLEFMPLCDSLSLWVWVGPVTYL